MQELVLADYNGVTGDGDVSVEVAQGIFAKIDKKSRKCQQRSCPAQGGELGTMLDFAFSPNGQHIVAAFSYDRPTSRPLLQVRPAGLRSERLHREGSGKFDTARSRLYRSHCK